MPLKRQLNTQLNEAEEILFLEWKKENGIKTDYSATKKLVMDGIQMIGGDINPKSKPEEMGVNGNFYEDVERATKGFKKVDLERALRRMDGKTKVKNTIKKAGAFHDQRAMIDIMSLVNRGKPTLMEIKYHVDWWYMIAVLANAVAMKGGTMTRRFAYLKDMWKVKPGVINQRNYQDWLSENDFPSKGNQMRRKYEL